MKILADVESWAADVEKLVSSGVAAATPILGEIDDALKAVNSVATIINNFTARTNTPEMQNASNVDKLKAFKDVINEHLAAGKPADEAALEKAEASS